MNWVFICNDALRYSGFCISQEDFIMIILNIIVFSAIVAILYRNHLIKERNIDSLSCQIKNPFTILGEGTMNKYYQPMSVQQKDINPKKKMLKSNNSNNNASSQINDKASGVNELQCNLCGNSVKVSYQYTLYKLINV